MNDKRLTTDNEIARQLVRTWPAFFSKFGRLTEVQRRVIPKIMAGGNILVSSATASGKTEAVCAPLFERFLSFSRPWKILYISPTRALVNDLYHRLYHSVYNELSSGLARRTGDHHDQIKVNSRLIITTPESFDSLLCRGKTEKGHVLADVVAVVMDEIHLMFGTSRGEQLKWLLKRLQLLRDYFFEQGLLVNNSMQFICLSATLADPDLVAKMYLGDYAHVIVVPGKREIETVTVSSDNPSIEVALPLYIEELEKPEKILVFCNARKRVDRLAVFFKKILPEGYAVYAHHGSLSKQVREKAEHALKVKDQVILVATSTLEIGIDIGDVDLVVLDGPAPNVSSLLQRIGRGNRRTNATRVMACSGNVLEVIVHSAMIEAASKGDYGREIDRKNYGTIIQQLASYIFQSPHQQRSRQKVLDFIQLCAPEVNSEKILNHLLAIEEFDECTLKRIHLGNTWLECTESGAIHSNIESSYGSSIVDSDSGEIIATGINLQSGQQLSIGGDYLSVKRWKERSIEVKKISNSLGLEAHWSYCSKTWINDDEQPYCVSKYLGIFSDDWPVLQGTDGVYVFHFGGLKRKIFIKILSHLNPDLLTDVKVNNWYLFFPHRYNFDVSRNLNKLSKNGIEKYIISDIDAVERRLGRPAINRKFPLELRRDEIISWLDLEKEKKIIDTARFPVVDNQETRDVLTLFVTYT